jgi:predicted enzyme related to lactoylglutathione lyase
MPEDVPLFRTIDCIRLPVPDIDTGLGFYRDALGHQLIWRSAEAAGLRMPGTDAELVIYTDGGTPETDLLVDDVAAAVERLTAAGAKVRRGPFDITIGRCAVVEDPFGNALVVLDASKGKLRTDAEGNVTGVTRP